MGTSSLRRLVGQMGLYAIGNAVVKASGLLLAPLYLNQELLPATAYASFVLFEATGQVAMLLAGVGINLGMLKYYTDPTMGEARVALPFTALVATVISTLPVAALFWLAGPLIGPTLFGAGTPAAAVSLLGAYVLFKSVATIPLTLLRTQERVGWYIAAVSAETFVLVAGSFALLVGAKLGLLGVMLAQASSAGISALVLVVAMLLHVPLKLRVDLIPRLLRFGAPLLISGVSSRVLNLGDRYVLRALAPLEALAVYGWATRLSGVLNMLLVQSAQLAFSVLGLKSLAAGDVDLHRRVFRHYVAGMGAAALGLSLFSYDLTVIIVQRFGGNPTYLEAVPQVFPLSLGFVAFGVYLLFENVMYAASQTRAIGVNMALAAVFNILLNFILVPFLGGMGSALATLLAYGGLLALGVLQARKLTPIAYPWSVLVIVLGTTTLLWLAGWASQSLPLLPGGAVRLLLMVAYGGALLAGRVYRLDELRRGLSRLWPAGGRPR